MVISGLLRIKLCGGTHGNVSQNATNIINKFCSIKASLGGFLCKTNVIMFIFFSINLQRSGKEKRGKPKTKSKKETENSLYPGN